MSMFISSLAGKMNKDQQFGKDTDFGKAFNEPNNSSNSSAVDKTVLDLDIIIEKWIAFMWEKTKTKQSSKQQVIEFEDLDIVVNWNKVEINQEEAIFKEKTQPNKKIHQQTLFRTYFTNKTDKDQEYSFKTERTTRQSCSFTFIKGFSREKEGSISFKLPYDVVELAGGLKSEQSIECGKDQTNEEEITWGVDSLIKVGPKTKTTAELIINELEMEKEFNVITYLKGRLSVILNSKRDNNVFLKSFQGDIAQILTLAIDKHWINSEGNKIQFLKVNNSDIAKIECSGKCKLRLGVEQHINLKDEKL